MFLLKVVHSLKIYQFAKFHGLTLTGLVQVLHPPQKFECPPFWNAWRSGIKKYGFEVTFNGMTSLLNFIKVYQLVKKLLGGTRRRTDRQTSDLTSLTFLFKESRLKTSDIGHLCRQHAHFVHVNKQREECPQFLFRVYSLLYRESASHIFALFK
jgi:hypothetical protein